MAYNTLAIVHICPDEKFIDGAYHSFNLAFPGQNSFYVLKPIGAQKIKYIRTIPNLNKVVEDGYEIPYLLNVISHADLVVLYGINQVLCELVERYAYPSKFLWLVLGAELYQNPYVYAEEVLGPLTRQLQESISNKTNLIEILKSVYREIRYRHLADKMGNKDEWLVRAAQAMRRVRFCGTLIEEEFSYLASHEKLAEGAVHLPFTFYPIEYFSSKFITDSKPDEHKLSNILVGNSGSSTNNHLELFEILKQFNLQGKNLITPLSYGDKRYISLICSEGKKYFGGHFHPLTKFMPFDLYNNIISSCSVAIMNHYRQQGVGNILTALYTGSKVFISKQNIMYPYLKRIGCRVFSIEDGLVPSNLEALNPLAEEDIQLNQNVLQAEISADKVVSQLRCGILNYLSFLKV